MPAGVDAMPAAGGAENPIHCRDVPTMSANSNSPNSGGSSPLAKLIPIAVIAVLALVGLYFFLFSGSKAPAPAKTAQTAPAAGAPAAAAPGAAWFTREAALAAAIPAPVRTLLRRDGW
jgi:cell division protein FtsN